MGVLFVTHAGLCAVYVRWGSVVKWVAVAIVVINSGRVGWWKSLEDDYGGC